nr:putative matrix protein [Serpentovirales sp.]
MISTITSGSMETVKNYFSSTNTWARKYVKSMVELDSVLQVLAFFLMFQCLMQFQRVLVPWLNSNIIIRKVHNLMHVCHLILIFVLFYSVDAVSYDQRTNSQKLTLVIFSLLVIGLVCYVGFYLSLSVLMLFRHRSLKLALAGPKSFIMDNNVYPVDCYAAVIVITKTSQTGFTEVRFGEHCLSAVPSTVVYKSLLTTEYFTYHSTITKDKTTCYVFKTDTENVKNKTNKISI